MTDLQQHTEKRETRQTKTLTSDTQFNVSTVDSTAWFTFKMRRIMSLGGCQVQSWSYSQVSCCHHDNQNVSLCEDWMDSDITM